MLKAPAKQNATDTINTLCGRISSATLLEDRRAAILGLRSFAKEYPASVASGALRSLIGSLRQDTEDVDTVKVVLETLLMLFNPNDNSVGGHSLWAAKLVKANAAINSQKLRTISRYGLRMNSLRYVRCCQQLLGY